MQASVAKKKPGAFFWKLTKEHRSAGVGGKEKAFYLRPLNLPCGFTFARSARMRIEHARSNITSARSMQGSLPLAQLIICIGWP